MPFEQFFGAATAWVSDVDKGANKVLAHRYPGVPNLGDITAVDLVAGRAGRHHHGRLSMPGLVPRRQAGRHDRGHPIRICGSGMRDAIAHLRPTYVVWENVRGAYSAEADSEPRTVPGMPG